MDPNREGQFDLREEPRKLDPNDERFTETAQRFYEKRGYLRQKLLRHYYADRSDAYLMEKALP